MNATRFEKYEGLGNDFVIVEADGPLGSERAVRICDRHFGVGADGVLVVAPPSTAGSRATMIVENADGSRPEMCGNGLRCVALHLARTDGVDRAEYVVDTDAGPRQCVVDRTDDAGRALIHMGPGKMLGEHRTVFGGEEYRFAQVSVGNPHAIRVGSPLEVSLIDELGPEVSRRIAGGTNVEFVTERGHRSYDVVVWERGVGRTLACGTGAAAAAVALAVSGRAPFGEPLEIRLPGGPLELSVAEGSLEVLLRGPARRVFSGEFPAE